MESARGTGGAQWRRIALAGRWSRRRHRRDKDGDHVTRVRQENERGNGSPHVVAVQQLQHAAGFLLPRACVRAYVHACVGACVGASIRFQIGARLVHAALPPAANRRTWIKLERGRERYVPNFLTPMRISCQIYNDLIKPEIMSCKKREMSKLKI